MEVTPVLKLVLDTRHVFTPYQTADFNNVLNQVLRLVPQHEVWYLNGWGNLKNSFTFCTDNSDIANELMSNDILLTHPVLGELKFKFEIKTPPPEDPEKALKDIKIVFMRCCTGEMLYMKDKVFDDAVKRTWGISLVQGTQMERLDNGAPTGNRFCIIKGFDLERLSAKLDKLVVKNPLTSKSCQIECVFDGKVNVCRCCKDTHPFPCPDKKRFFYLKNKKSEEKHFVNVDIFSDSQFRYLECVGLRANVTSISGATIGHLANIIRDNPRMTFKNVLFLIGVNNVDTEKSIPEFVQKSTVEVRRLVSAINSKKFHSVTIIPGVRICENEIVKQQMSELEKIFRTAVEHCNWISIHTIDPATIEFDPESDVHPSRNGTLNLLNQLSHIKAFGNLIIDRQFAVVFPKKNIYTGVNSSYRYGCRFCENTYMVLEGCCTDCKTDDQFSNSQGNVAL